MNVFEEIHEFTVMSLYAKHEQLAQSIINAVGEKSAVHGSAFSAVNGMMVKVGFARETMMKSYFKLLSLGVIEVEKGMGYFVAQNSSKQELKIALLMYATGYVLPQLLCGTGFCFLHVFTILFAITARLMLVIGRLLTMLFPSSEDKQYSRYKALEKQAYLHAYSVTRYGTYAHCFFARRHYQIITTYTITDNYAIV